MGRSENFLEAERQQLLAELIPPVVHRLNNSLAVLAGQLEAPTLPAGDISAALAESSRREMGRLTATLRQLSMFARSSARHEEPFDLGSTLSTVENLVLPLAHHRAVELALRVPPGELVLRGDPQRIEQLLVTLLGRAVLAAAPAPGDDQRALLRISVRRGSGRLVLSIVHGAVHVRGPGTTVAVPARVARNGSASPTEPDDPTGPSAVLSRAADWAREAGVRLSMRRHGAAACYRIVLPAASEVAEALTVGAATSTPGARLVLVGPDASLRELVQTLLEDAGYRLEVRERIAGPEDLPDPAADALVLDTDAERQVPGLVRRLLEGEGTRPALLLLGRSGAGEPEALAPSTSGRRVLVLDKPFRPQQLLAALARIL